IGRGSYGVVYAAHDPVLGREVAIKVIPLASEERYRTQIEASFLREAKSAGGMSHPSIVTVYDAGKTDAMAYIAMERLHGQDLHEYLASGNRMSPRQAAAMMMRVADAIQYANKRGLVHRDIKPSNIFLSRDLKPKLLDFGTALAPVAEPAPKGTRQLIGTPNYMSPEQAKGEALDARSDIFSLGAILYELLAGRRAFDGRTVDETLDRVIDAVPKPVEKIRPETPAALAHVVRKAMSPNPADRYQKASELRNALAEFVDGSRPASIESTTKASAARPVPAPAPSRGPLLFGLALIALLGVGGAALFLPPRGTAPAIPESATPVPIIPPMAPPPPAVDAAPASPAINGTDASKAEKAAARKRVEPAPSGDGTVTVAVAPWGEVVVDGTVQGVSPPLTEITLPPGLHTIEVRNGSFPPFVARVELKAGEKVHLQHRF
ncbi:MAG TPA: serine/threonine-protein kinase, partial [Burkholderiaceae bacterium]|nr:serine/threonine-protein kinase [Burkholderiaceae bacterium]